MSSQQHPITLLLSKYLYCMQKAISQARGIKITQLPSTTQQDHPNITTVLELSLKYNQPLLFKVILKILAGSCIMPVSINNPINITSTVSNSLSYLHLPNSTLPLTNQTSFLVHLLALFLNSLSSSFVLHRPAVSGYSCLSLTLADITRP